MLFYRNTVIGIVSFIYTLHLQQTISDENVQEIDIPRRKCRFPDENNLTVARKYSFAACNLQCQKKAHMILYNCTHHYMPFACNYLQNIAFRYNICPFNEKNVL